MHERDPVSEELRGWIDAYLDGVLDEAGLRALDARLRSDPAARQEFVRYCRMYIDLHMEARARQAGERALRLIDGPQEGARAAAPPNAPRTLPSPPSEAGVGRARAAFRLFSGHTLRIAVAVALALLFTGLWWRVGQPAPEPPGDRPAAVAWLVNAENCRWAAGVEPTGDLEPGSRLRIERGLAELCFRSGARVVLEGPAELELLSDNSARLLRGRLAARVPPAATGFTVLSPQGKLIDLGTEFGVSVDDGAANVVVFAGEVQANPTTAAGIPVELKKGQEALLDKSGVILQPAPAPGKPFVREITAAPVLVPRTLALDFRRMVDASIHDATDQGTGLTHRLPGTGAALPAADPNLRLNLEAGRLGLTTTQNDLNGQYRLSQGEYPGVRLSDLGFTGTEDFSVTADIPQAPVLESADQFGLYAGVRSDKNIRGGFLRPGEHEGEGHSRQFIVVNNGGDDSHLYQVGPVSIGDNLRLTLQRVQGKYSLMVENRTTGQSSTLAIAQSEFLDGEPDLYVGLFGATPWRNKSRTLFVSAFQATVWTRSP